MKYLAKTITIGLLALSSWGCGRSSQVAFAQGGPPANPEPLRQLLVQQKEQTGVRAVLAGVWVADQEVLRVALGDSMTGVPAQVDMRVRIGGVSETMLATIFLRLVERGTVHLDDKVSRWLPHLLAADQVTLNMLIKNTAGYKDYVTNPDFVQLVTRQPFRTVTRAEIYHYASVESGGTLAYPPGTSQAYSHTDFTVLADCLERATGKTMAELYQQEIFDTVHLNQSGYSTTPELPFPLHAFSSDRGVYEDATFWNPSWTGDSGPAYSTLADLRSWSKAFGQGQLLTPASFAELVRNPSSGPPADPYFASGFIVNRGWYAQNPGFNGYSGAFAYLPARDITVVVYSTAGENPLSDGQAFKILKKLAALVAPQNPITF